jgi:hypothetical protein
VSKSRVQKQSSEDSRHPSAEMQENPLFEILCNVCQCRYFYLTSAKRERFDKALLLLTNGKCSPEALESFGEKWYEFWRCTQNGYRPPEPLEILECWDQVMNPRFMY